MSQLSQVSRFKQSVKFNCVDFVLIVCSVGFVLIVWNLEQNVSPVGRLNPLDNLKFELWKLNPLDNLTFDCEPSYSHLQSYSHF